MNKIPNIEFIDGRFEGKVSLPVWKDFQNTQELYDSLEAVRGLNEEFRISIGGDMVVANPTITPEHINSYNYLITHSEQISNSILTRLFSEYKNLRNEYGYEENDTDETMPDVDNIEQFKKLVGLSQVHLMNVSKDNIAYVGYQFDCNWDDEHGLGFMTHRDRVVAFGGAHTSSPFWRKYKLQSFCVWLLVPKCRKVILLLYAVVYYNH